jgi:transcription initiation factor TFIIB
MMQNSTICEVCSEDSKTPRKVITDPESGEIVCSNCGTVITDRAQDDGHSELRAFTIDEFNDKTRTGMPISLARHDKGLATIIGRADKDASGRGLDPAMSTTMARLRTWDFRTQTHTPTDRNLKTAFNQLITLKDKLGLPDVAIEKTAYVYRKVQERGLVRGRTISAVLAVAAYVACREMGIPRTLDDIASLTNTKRKELAKVYRLIVLELDLKIPMVDPMKCIVKVANKANVSEKTKRYAIDMMNSFVIKSGISAGKDPMGLAGSVLYLSSKYCGENKSQVDIAEAAGVTEVTIRNRFKDLKKYVPLLN